MKYSVYTDLSTKFLGKLNGINIKIIDDELITYLLDNGVFKSSTNDLIREKDSIHLATSFFFNNNHYSLTDDFISELYKIFKFYVETILSGGESIETIQIDSNLNGFLDNPEKIKYLKSKYSEVFPRDNQLYSIYEETKPFNFYSWISYFQASFETIDNLFIKYLTSKRIFDKKSNNEDEAHLNNLDISSYIFTELMPPNKNQDLKYFLSEWVFCFEKKSVLDFIENKIKGLHTKADNYSFKDCFKYDNQYDYFILDLKNEQVIDDNMNLIIEDSKELMLISAMCYLLFKKGYIEGTQKKICSAISKEFGVELKQNTYSNHKKVFDKFFPEHISNEDHLDRLHFIK